MTDQPPPIDDERALRTVRELMTRENRGEKASIRIGPFGAYLLISMIQLASRHPDLSPEHRRIMRVFAAQAEPLFEGTDAAEILAAGWDPRQDRPIE